MRLSGAGEMLVEDNDLSDCAAALVARDLFKYWYESGRVRHLVFRNNRLRNCNGKGGSCFIRVGIDGLDAKTAPKIHQTVEIYGNTFAQVKQYAVKCFGTKELILRDNVTEDGAPLSVVVDGKEAERA